MPKPFNCNEKMGEGSLTGKNVLSKMAPHGILHLLITQGWAKTKQSGIYIPKHLTPEVNNPNCVLLCNLSFRSHTSYEWPVWDFPFTTKVGGHLYCLERQQMEHGLLWSCGLPRSPRWGGSGWGRNYVITASLPFVSFSARCLGDLK